MATCKQVLFAGDVSDYPWEGAWVTSTLYYVNDCVEENGSGYVCLIEHTSGTFATDLTALKWSLFVQGTSDHTGDVTGGTDLTIAANAVELSMMASLTAEAVIGNATGGAATPTAITLAEQTVLGRLTGLHVDDIAIGLADNNIVQVDGTTNVPVDNDYAIWTASGLEGLSIAEVKSNLSLGTMAYETATDYITKTTIGDQGSLLYASSDGTPASLAHATTAGQFLASGGHGAAPYWTASTGNVATDAIWNQVGDIAVGTGANTAAIVTTVGHSDGEVLTVQADGSVDWEAAGVITTLDGLSDVTITTQEQGDIIFASSGSAWENLHHDSTTAGQLLQSGGHAGNPSWATIGQRYSPYVVSTDATVVAAYVCD